MVDIQGETPDLAADGRPPSSFAHMDLVTKIKLLKASNARITGMLWQILVYQDVILNRQADLRDSISAFAISMTEK